MNKKYELTDETQEWNGRTLHRIRALADFGDVKAGELGGWIEKEENLSHNGNAWVYGDAQVCGDAWVCGDAQVCGDAWVYGDAQVCNNARVYGDAWVCGDARVYGDAWVYGDARVYGDAQVCDNARVCGDALVYGDAWVCDNAWVCGNAWVYGDAQVCNNARVYGNAGIFKTSDYFTSGPIGSRRNATITFFRCKDGKIRATTGCFYGDLDQLEAAVRSKHQNNNYAQAYMAVIAAAKAQIGADQNV